mmetsp:Transcript_42417/g.31072  ORF Transcript_42417/g.31072 Transcript_42417/m.31072 type:complete len:112 (-) Transcript_42417:684-1019(-)
MEEIQRQIQEEEEKELRQKGGKKKPKESLALSSFTKSLFSKEDNSRRQTESSKSAISLEEVETASLQRFKFNIKSVNDFARALVSMNKHEQQRNQLTYDRLRQDDFKKVLK